MPFRGGWTRDVAWACDGARAKREERKGLSLVQTAGVSSAFFARRPIQPRSVVPRTRGPKAPGHFTAGPKLTGDSSDAFDRDFRAAKFFACSCRCFVFSMALRPRAAFGGSVSHRISCDEDCAQEWRWGEEGARRIEACEG